MNEVVGDDANDDAVLAELLARRRRRRARHRIGAIVTLAGMVLGFSGLIVFDRIDPADPPAPSERVVTEDQACISGPTGTGPGASTPSVPERCLPPPTTTP